MKKYFAVFKLRFSNSLQYRAAALAGVVTQTAWGLMEIFAYRAFYRANPGGFEMTFEQLTSYIWLQQAFLAMLAVWFYDNDILEDIRSGNIAYELVRPVRLYDLWFAKNMGTRLSKVALRAIPMFIVAALLPAPYGISLPPDIPTFLIFTVSLMMSFFVVVSIVLLVYVSALYTLNTYGMRVVLSALSELFGGAIIPLPFFPSGIRRVAELLPFASGQNVPFRIYSGNLTGASMWQALALQLFWLVALYTLGRVWMRTSMRRVVVQGG